MKSSISAASNRQASKVLRLVTPGSDGTMRTLRVSGKPNVLISPQNLANVRFVSSTGVMTIPRNRMISSSPAQTSHPVIQQLLLNQAANTSTALAGNSNTGRTLISAPKTNIQNKV